MGTKQARLSVNLFSLENRKRELNWKVAMGTLAPWCIMLPEITDFGMARDVCQENIYEKKSKVPVFVIMICCVFG